MTMIDGIRTTHFEITHTEDKGKVVLTMTSATENLDVYGNTGSWVCECTMRKDKFDEMTAFPDWKADFRNSPLWTIITGKLFRHGVLFAEKKAGGTMEVLS